MANRISSSLAEFQLNATMKGVPGGTKPFPLSCISEQHWNVLREDLPLPLLVLKRSALLHNIGAMNTFLQKHHLSIAPHVKTHMSPQLANLQLSSGAWAITVATVNQLQVFRQFGVHKILLANQLVGRQNVRYIVEELNSDDKFNFFCLVDSAENVAYLAALAQEFNLTRPIKVLLEGGYFGGRSGCRTSQQAKTVLTELRKHPRYLTLVGLGGFEGVINADSSAAAVAKVNEYLGFLKDLLTEIGPEDLGSASEMVLSAGGSAYFDLVAKAFHQLDFFLPKRILLRSGCYLTHDSRMYYEFHEQMSERQSGQLGFQPAFEIWSYVQSIPEKGLAILTMGKRDCPYDYYLPSPLRRFRTNENDVDLSSCQIARLNDQHAYLEFSDGLDIRFGDLIVCGISHPCTAFDKWRFIPVINDEYDVIDGLITFF
ncbi:MAG TPA: amino acid deaminase [Candidatus Acidoferrum sp.]